MPQFVAPQDNPATVAANGASIPSIGYGTWPLKGDECATMVEAALRAGYRHIDTAAMYENEAAVGQGIRASGVARHDIFLTTKIWPDKLTEGVFQREVEAGINRLGVGAVDLLLIHWPPKGRSDVGEWMRLLNDAAARGWTHHIGVSNFTVPMIDAAFAASERPLVCNQVENHPFIDQRKVRAACDRHGMTLVAYSPLFQGGDALKAAPVAAAASAHGVSAGQVILRWHVQHGGVAIPKTATEGRLPENLDVFSFALTGEEMADIDALRERGQRKCDFEFSPDWDVPGAA